MIDLDEIKMLREMTALLSQKELIISKENYLTLMDCIISLLSKPKEITLKEGLELIKEQCKICTNHIDCAFSVPSKKDDYYECPFNEPEEMDIKRIVLIVKKLKEALNEQ